MTFNFINPNSTEEFTDALIKFLVASNSKLVDDILTHQTGETTISDIAS